MEPGYGPSRTYLLFVSLMLFFGSPVPAGSSGMLEETPNYVQDADTVMLREIIITATQSLLDDSQEIHDVVVSSISDIRNNLKDNGRHVVSDIVPEVRGSVAWQKIDTEGCYIATAIFGEVERQIHIAIDMEVISKDTKLNNHQFMMWVSHAAATNGT